jgi:hypothetical protein
VIYVVFTEVKIQVEVFLVVTLRSVVIVTIGYHCFGGPCLHL